MKRHEEAFGVTPAALENQPKLSLQNQVYFETFWILSKGRQNTDHVLNPISFSEVMLYCDCIEEFDGFERLRYWEMVSACDAAFLTATLEQRAIEMKKQQAIEKSKARR